MTQRIDFLVDRDAGTEAVERVYREVLEGRTAPQQGHVLSLHAAPR